ncbi:hypothetical protein BDB00DRAFT_940264 [Zychaea mexicana]|uniref:uncharacterized protein n=1 Tax=Zychaea mexicana TaxID=64656 RepID=UPI0022FDF0E8|nr:uncharacterized protein BDB00DRAFT_940264 [Zychaea mexicana]KAI9491476.1 hypothetical protein BDB00DRAFT_940264 [Zychaea mexicana]
MNTSSPPLPFFDAGLFKQFIQQCNTSIQIQDYQQAVHDTTVAIDQIFQSQLLALLAIRAKAQFLQCQHQAASDDALKITRIAPELATGYLQQARIFSAFGYQKRAIEAYDQGLQNVGPDQSDGHQKLEAEKAEAIAIQRKGVDFIRRLPSDCAYDIISLLPLDTKMTCLLVSDTWRQITLECNTHTWKHFTAHSNDSQLATASSHFGYQTEHLIIDISDTQAFAAYLNCLRDGHFERLHYLKVTSNAADAIRQNISFLPRAFYGARNTLTCLDLDMGSNKNPVTVVEILSACSSVVSLTYTTLSYTTFKLAKYISSLNSDHLLRNLVIKSPKLDGDDIQYILRRCQRIQRLVLHGCVPSILDTVVKQAPNLQIFGYNPGKPTRNLRDIVRFTNDKQPGLRVLQMDNRDINMRAPISSIIPILYKHRATLTDLSLNVAPNPTVNIYGEAEELRTTYPDLSFPNLTTVTTWLLSYAQDSILEILRYVPKLTVLSAVNIHDLEGFTRNIDNFPSLVQLRLSHIRTETTRSDLLLVLFQQLAERSATGQKPSLEHIRLFQIADLDDDVFYMLAEIRTLCSFELRCKGMTTYGIRHFISKLGNQLRHARLVDTDTVTDDVLAELCGSKNLEWVSLEKLNKVSAEGVNHLLANMKSAKFTTVKVKNCPKISDVDRDYTKQSY